MTCINEHNKRSTLLHISNFLKGVVSECQGILKLLMEGSRLTNRFVVFLSINSITENSGFNLELIES